MVTETEIWGQAAAGDGMLPGLAPGLREFLEGLLSGIFFELAIDWITFPDTLLFVGTSCLSVTGTIEGKFDSGYPISVTLGSQVLSGVIYHPEQHPASECSNAIVPYKHIRSGRQSGKDPSHLKPNRSINQLFYMWMVMNVGVPEHRIERQGKILERIEGVQRATEAGSGN
ncbi:hypothetical protein V6N13_139151 [Hibiscus sabdariffa]|uniref:Uncharacterized protein n=1 Tax=Hibiscus sabdariffa TaxID=183260 RepID=A0ABR2PKW9_9ROSI